MSASSRPAPPPLTAEELAREEEWKADLELAFERGVEIAFSRWEALNIAVNNLAGDGNEKAEEFINTAIEWFMDEKDKICWDDVEGWLQEVLSEEFHIDAQDGSCEQMGRLLTTLYRDVFGNPPNFRGLHTMIRTQSEVSKRLMEARRIGTAESDRHNRLVELEEEVDGSDMDEEGEDDDDDTEERKEGDAAADGVAALNIGSSSSSSSAAPSSAASAAAAPVEEKTAEQLQDEADGWATVPTKKGGKKGGKK